MLFSFVANHNTMNKLLLFVSAVTTTVILMRTVGCSSIERLLLFYPTHRPAAGALTPWTKDGAIIGYARKVASPRNVWLMLHGNGGQAEDRLYAIPSFLLEDAVYILEYPGYGSRPGVPSRKAFDQAAQEAYLLLRKTYPEGPVCVVGESIGSGPASFLATLDRPPDKLVLIVPYDRLSLVAKDHFPSFLVNLLLKTDWDNSAVLSRYNGRVEIFGAAADSTIPVRHAQALAAAVPGSRFVLIEGGHNDWPEHGRVKIRNP
jgi:uncharacterized protein